LNAGAKRLSSLLTAGSAAISSGGTGRARFNMLDALAAPGGLARRITNLKEVGPALLARLRREARAIPELAPRVQALEDRVRAQLGPAHAHIAEDVARAPVLTTSFDTPLGRLAFFSMFTTFGTPQDITLASLRVELLFAADSATAAIWNQSAVQAGASHGEDVFG
jgi:hypothetical protein